MKTDSIIIKNAHANNLKSVDIELPKHSIVVFTGVSGSGKSSLLFDTIYTEAQRQLIETFSSFARARLPKLSRPDVDEIKHLSTPIVIDQKKMGNNLRSTVGTATELATYIRLLYSRIGQPFLDIIRRADWIIDLGPEGGKNGGEILFGGTPEDLKSCKSSITARYI